MDPVIGICAAVERVSWGVWDGYEVTLAPRSYVRCVQRAAGIAIVLPPAEAAVEEPDLLLDRIDGLMLAGGADIDPSSYGTEPHPETRGTWPERDRFELALARRALARDMPVLGICRGMQLLNVALGGTLVQHLPETLGNEEHRTVAGTFSEHHVRLDPTECMRLAALHVHKRHLRRTDFAPHVRGRLVGSTVNSNANALPHTTISTANATQSRAFGRDGIAEIWRFAADSCFLDVFLYRERDGLRIAHLDARPKNGAQRITPQSCYGQILSERGGPSG